MSLLKSWPDQWQLRPLTQIDVPSVQQVQAECYDATFLERGEVFEQRLACAHQCSVGVVQSQDLTLHAYLVAYWSQMGKITPFNGEFLEPETDQPILYLHDMSVRPQSAGQGLAGMLFQTVLAQAHERGVQQAALVSVSGSQAFWARYGFELQALDDPEQQAHLTGYGQQACYMVAPLQGTRVLRTDAA